MEIVGNNLRSYRMMRHMTQEGLAKKVGISISHCANIEQGKTGVSMYVLKDFADALDITVNQLLYDECDAEQHISNIRVLLQDKPTSFLSWIEKVFSIPNGPNDTFPDTK